jgi:hypothetical protein
MWILDRDTAHSLARARKLAQKHTPLFPLLAKHRAPSPAQFLHGGLREGCVVAQGGGKMLREGHGVAQGARLFGT